MTFNELSSVEHHIIHQLIGVYLNEGRYQEPQPFYRAQCTFKAPGA